MNQIIGGDLRKLEKDGRDFRLGEVIVLPKLSELPKEYIVADLPVEAQLSSDFCAAYASCKISEAQEGVRLEPSYTFAYSKYLTGDPESYGQNLRDICRAHVKVGALEKPAVFDISSKSASFLREITNWPPDSKSKAEVHRKASFFSVTGPHDPFDNCKTTMYALFNRETKSGAIMGVEWGWPLEQVELTESNGGGGHALAIIGFTERHGEQFIILQNSYGIEAGDKGRHYISRGLFNAYAQVYGVFMFTDIPASAVIAQQWTPWQRFISWIKNYFKEIWQ